MVHNMIRFYGEELLAPRSTPKLEDHPFSAVRNCLFNIFAAIFLTGGRSSNRNPEDTPCRGDRALVNALMNLRVPQNAGNFLTS